MTKKEIFNKIEKEYENNPILIRAIGFIVMFLAFFIIVGTHIEWFNWIPLVRKLIDDYGDTGALLISSIIISLMVESVVISVVYMYHKPAIGLTYFVLFIVIFALLMFF